MPTATDSRPDPVTGPLQILLGSPDAELSTRDIAKVLHVSQPTVVRRLAQARLIWDRTRRRAFWRDVMFFLLTLSALVAAISLALIAASRL